MIPKISIKKGREWQLKRGHPWLFSGAVSQAPGGLKPGAIVDLVDYDGRFVARGYCNPHCDIAVRVLTWKPGEEINSEFFSRRLEDALALRMRALDPSQTNVYRLVNAEGDLLPGFIADRYADVLVLQSHTAGSDFLMPFFLEALDKTVQAPIVIVRNDVAARKREGLSIEEPAVVKGSYPGPTLVQENGLRFAVDTLRGQKTGFFTDQRDKRAALQQYARRLPPGAVLLNCFSYAAAFSIYAAAVAPHIRTINVDQSQRAHEEARRCFEINDLNPTKHEFSCADVFTWLEAARSKDERFDVVILDPPAFAKSHKDKAKAVKGYTRLNSLGFSLVKSSGLLISCSCSGSIDLGGFSECLRDAAAAANRQVQILQTFTHGVDHPINLAAPETGYLKVLFCRVL